jgi:hypothetical protein
VAVHERGRNSYQHEHQTADWRPMEGEYAGIDTNNRRQVVAHDRGRRSFQHEHQTADWRPMGGEYAGIEETR